MINANFFRKYLFLTFLSKEIEFFWIFFKFAFMKEKYDVATEKEKKSKKETQETYEFSQEKQKLRTELEKKEKLNHLEEMLEKWIVSEQSVKKLENLSPKEQQEIQKTLEKISEITDVDPKGKILPKSMQITKNDYLKALSDPIKKQQLLSQVDDNLSYLYNQVSQWWIVNLMSYFQVFFIGNDFKTVQENMIDIKNNLQTKK